jgi:hypothetical protein
MDATDQTSDVILLERPAVPGAAWTPVQLGPAPTAPGDGRPMSGGPRAAAPLPPAARAAGYRGPALGALAAVSILVGYRWLGVIAVGGSRASNLVMGRAGAIVVAGLALWLTWAVAGSAAGPTRRAHRLVLAAAGLAALAAVALMLHDAPAVRYAFGVAELLLASLSGAVLVIDERRRRATGSKAPAVSSPSNGPHDTAIL